jgi:uncharacterized protein (TIGR02118 family)
VTKLFVFLKRRPDLDDEQFWAHWLDVHAPLVIDRPVFRRLARRYVVNRPIAGAAIPELTLSDLDGAAEFWFDSLDDLLATVTDESSRALEADVANFADTARTIFLVAEESVQFDRGFGAVKFMGLSRRAGSFATTADWVRYWVDVHGPLAHGIPDFTRYYGRYVHNYVVPDALPGPPSEYDGVVEEWLDSVDAFARCLAEPKYLELVRPDEVKFVDFTRSHMLLVEELALYGGGREGPEPHV